jgi:RNA polymerase sigma-70 factor (ECF subfamily)
MVIVVMHERGAEPLEGSRPPINVDDIVRAAQRGDPLAMNRLLRALGPVVGPICGAIALDQGDDAMQETMIAVVRNLKSLREPAAVHGWARRIATREAVRVAKRRPVTATPEQLDRPSPGGAEDAMAVRDMLDRLQPEQRAILVLRDVAGMSEAEAAAALAVAPGTVKSRLHRARAAFRKGWEA